MNRSGISKFMGTGAPRNVMFDDAFPAVQAITTGVAQRAVARIAASDQPPPIA